MSNDIHWFDGPLETLLVSPTGAVGLDLARRGVRVESGAKVAAPFRFGRLRSSIRTAPGDASGSFVVCVMVVASTGAAVTIGSDVEYSGYQELGTRYMAANPYLRPSLPLAA